MENYDQVISLLNGLKESKDSYETEMDELTNIFTNESAREIVLILSEWLSTYSEAINFAVFMRISPLIIIILDHLRAANKFIVQDFIQSLDCFISQFENTEVESIFTFFNVNRPKNPHCTYFTFLSILINEINEEIATGTEEIFLGNDEAATKEVATQFSKLPTSYQFSCARCASLHPDKFIPFSLERLALLLLNSSRHFRKDGVVLSSKITNPSDPSTLFRTVISVGPYLPAIEDAKHALEVSLDILHTMNDENRFHSMRIALESEIPEATRSAITHELSKEIRTNKTGIFRSYMVGTLIPLVVPHYYLTSPVAKTESLLTGLNFVLFVLLLDRRVRTLGVFGSQEGMKTIQKMIETVKKSLAKASKDNEKSDKEMHDQMKKVNFGEEVKLDDIPKIREGSNSAIRRVKFMLSDFEAFFK